MKNVLVVDDCSTTRKILTYMIRDGGFRVISAENGIEALEKLATNTVDLVVTDLNMPQMDGLELCRSISVDDLYKDIPIIMISTESGSSDRDSAISSGVNTYLVKPISPEKLLEEVNKLI